MEINIDSLAKFAHGQSKESQRKSVANNLRPYFRR